MTEIEILLKRINELAAKAKSEGLSDEEIEERNELRQRYLKLFREGMREQLESITIVDQSGNSRKLKRNGK